jgi:Na+/glutamate symporter
MSAFPDKRLGKVMARDAMGSLAVAALVILFGRALHRGFPALTRWHIPEPVSGGTAWALGVALLHRAAGGPVAHGLGGGAGDPACADSPPPPALEALPGVTLALFLALASAALRLWELVALAGPLPLRAAQTLATALFARWIMFRLMGRDAEAAACAAGFFGFAIGSTATAVATMREAENHHGPMPRAILIVLLTAGLFVTLANALLLSLLLMLPLFAR